MIQCQCGLCVLRSVKQTGAMTMIKNFTLSASHIYNIFDKCMTCAA